ncbi:MAG: orotidine-5'-phosphate decarboxylase [Micromonosporaceae bacterium]|nr:orotidine-5'-phosphate decarboxylase [Micromonosporaceae bacterium]
MKRFGARLQHAIATRGPLCVGIDPHPSLLTSWGLPDTPEGLARFCAAVVEAVGESVAAVKPQSAFFERFGSAGVAVLESTIRHLHLAGTVVVLDVKRGDIGSTAAAYADAYLRDGAPLAADAITASPYLGVGSLSPMVDLAVQSGRGVFVLSRTTNPEGSTIQCALTADGRSVAQLVVDEIAQLNRGVDPVGDVGVVVGATIGTDTVDLSNINGPILLPGLGAQGGRPEDLRTVLGGGRVVALASSSRQVLSQGPNVSALRAAAERARDECATVLKITN